MTPQERQLVDDLFERLARLEATPRDPEAAAAITQGLRIAPNAIYGLVQAVLVQDEALKRAHDRIQELEADEAPSAQERGGFLDSMRDAIFGHSQPQRGSVPNVPPPGGGSRPSWNTGQVIGQQSAAPPYSQPAQPPYGQPQGQYGGPFGGQGASPVGGGGGGSFLGTAAAAAAGVVGGSLLLSSIRGMMGGGSQQSVADQTGLSGGTQSPWGGDAAGGNLAQQAGVGDIGSQSGSGDGNSRYGMMDQNSNDHDRVADAGYDHDDMDMDSDDFDGGGDSDFA